MRFLPWLRVVAPLAVVAASFAIVSCNSGSSDLSTTTTTTSTVAYSTPLPSSGGVIDLPSFGSGGYTATITVAASPPANDTLSTIQYAAAPTIAPAPSLIARGTSAMPAAARVKPLTVSGAIPFYWITLQVTAPTPLSLITAETLTLTSAVPITGANYAVEFDDVTTSPGTKLNSFAGSVSSATYIASFTNTDGSISGANPTLQPSDTYLMQFYYVPVASASPSPVATGLPLNGTAQSVTVPALNGFTATYDVGPIGTSGQTLTATGSQSLPSFVTSNTLPAAATVFYSLAVSTSSSVANCSGTACPANAVILTVPTTFSSGGSPIYVAECTQYGCPVSSGDVDPLTLTNLQLTVPSSAFADITGFTTNPTAYVFYYASGGSGTPPPPVTGATVTQAVAAGTNATIALPTTGNGIASSLAVAGFNTSTTVTAVTTNGLPAGLTAVVPANQTVLYSTAISASPGVSFSTGPTLTLTIPSSIVSAAGSENFHVEECNASVCPISSGDVSGALSISGSNLVIGPSTFPDINAFGSSPVDLVLYYSPQ